MAGAAFASLAASTPDLALLTRVLEAPGPTVAELGVEAAVVHLLAAGGWACLAWLTLAAAVAGLAHLPGAAGRVATGVAAVVTPALVRRTVEALLGVSALVGVVAPATASAASPVAGHRAPVAVQSAPEIAPRAAAPLALPGHGVPSVPSSDWPSSRPPLPTADWPTAERPTADRPAADRPTAERAATTQSPPGPGASGPRRLPGVAPGLVSAAPVRTDGTDAGVVVHRGDTLWSIAARHLGSGATAGEVARSWPRWHEANRAVIGPDPDRLLPGQLLVPPA